MTNQDPQFTPDKDDPLGEAIMLAELFKSQVGKEWFENKTGLQGFNAALRYMRRVWKVGTLDGK